MVQKRKRESTDPRDFKPEAITIKDSIVSQPEKNPNIESLAQCYKSKTRGYYQQTATGWQKASISIDIEPSCKHQKLQYFEAVKDLSQRIYRLAQPNAERTGAESSERLGKTPNQDITNAFEAQQRC